MRAPELFARDFRERFEVDVPESYLKRYEAIYKTKEANYDPSLSMTSKTSPAPSKFLGRPPYGYRWVKRDKKHLLVAVPKEIEAIKAIFTRYLGAKGYCDLSRKLESAGFVSRNGQPFSQGFLSKILNNEIYTTDPELGFIPEELAEKVQELIAKRKSGFRGLQ